MSHENMYFAESQMMGMLSDKVVQRVERQMRPRKRAQPPTQTVFTTTASGVFARVSVPAAAESRDVPVVAEGAELLDGLSAAERRELLLSANIQPEHDAQPPSPTAEAQQAGGRSRPPMRPPWARPRARASASASHREREDGDLNAAAKRPRRSDKHMQHEKDHSRLSFDADS